MSQYQGDFLLEAAANKDIFSCHQAAHAPVIYQPQQSYHPDASFQTWSTFGYAIEQPAQTPVGLLPPSPPSSTNAFTSKEGSSRRKPRAMQACVECRKRKQRCDEGRPCEYCREQSLICSYDETPSKYMTTRLSVDELTKKVDILNAQVQHLTKTLAELKEVIIPYYPPR